MFTTTTPSVSASGSFESEWDGNFFQFSTSSIPPFSGHLHTTGPGTYSPLFPNEGTVVIRGQEETTDYFLEGIGAGKDAPKSDLDAEVSSILLHLKGKTVRQSLQWLGGYMTVVEIETPQDQKRWDFLSRVKTGLQNL